MSITSQALTKGLSSHYYNDPELFAKTCENVFYSTWQFACHGSQVEKPGDYFCLSIFNQDIVIFCDKNRELKAFYNVCQHRGHRLLEKSGNVKVITCPYHAWAYNLDGKLRGAPNSRAVAGFNRNDICLTEIKLEDFLGFIFINLDPDCPSMDESYPEVRSAILELCPDFQARKYAAEHSCEEYCNWLVAVENYNECYHCKGVHPQFAKGIIDPATYNIAPFGSGKVLRHSSKATPDDAAWYDVSGSDYGSFFLWPATSIQIYPGGLVNSYYWRPLAVDNVRVHRGWFSDNGKLDESQEKVMQLDRDTTFAEDLELVKNVQRGLQSRGYRPGPLIIDPAGSIENELSIAMLHRWLKQAVDTAPTEHNGTPP